MNTVSPPLRTLFLSAAIGAGHHRAQRAVAKALQRQGVAVDAHEGETLDYMNRLERGMGVSLYEWELRHAPWLYRMFYESTDQGHVWNHFVEFMMRQGLKRYRPVLLDLRPDVVVNSFWAPCAVAGRIRDQARLPLLNTLIVTDYRTHLHWARQEADLLFVASQETAEQMVGRGIPAHRLAATGIPIADEFGTLQSMDRFALREQQGLRPDRPLILLSGGGHGHYRSLKEILAILGNLGQPVQVLVPVSSQAAQRGEFREEVGGAKVHHLGFRQDFPELMACADLVLGKAGGLTVAEATALGIPMVIYQPIPGQEEHNADFLERHQAGLWAKTTTELRRKVLRALDPDEHALLARGSTCVGKPDAADRVAEAIMRKVKQG